MTIESVGAKRISPAPVLASWRSSRSSMSECSSIARNASEDSFNFESEDPPDTRCIRARLGREHTTSKGSDRTFGPRSRGSSHFRLRTIWWEPICHTRLRRITSSNKLLLSAWFYTAQHNRNEPTSCFLCARRPRTIAGLELHHHVSIGNRSGIDN